MPASPICPDPQILQFIEVSPVRTCLPASADGLEPAVAAAADPRSTLSPCLAGTRSSCSASKEMICRRLSCARLHLPAGDQIESGGSQPCEAGVKLVAIADAELG